MEKHPEMNIIIISAACCVPGMDAFDGQARRIIERALAETGLKSVISVVPATTAMFGGDAYRKIMNELIAMSNAGKAGVPAVIINGEVVSFGVPQLEEMKIALLKHAEYQKEEQK